MHLFRFSFEFIVDITRSGVQLVAEGAKAKAVVSGSASPGKRTSLIGGDQGLIILNKRISPGDFPKAAESYFEIFCEDFSPDDTDHGSREKASNEACKGRGAGRI
jgi:hypothetical protein